MANNNKADIKKSLNNSALRGALGKLGNEYPIAREKSFKELDFEELRGKMKATKNDAIARLEELANEFEKQATSRGAIVYRAKNGEDAKKYILELAQKRGVKTVVKSKSMASEEIHLTDYLTAQGLDVAESDLGEWIIQQAGQRPSHMVMPAIHMTKEQVAEQFSKTLGENVDPDIAKMVKLARKELRGKFLTAEMGISGANVAVAETGTLAVYTNEGNARLTTTLPPIHVALVGYEKLVPNFSDTETVTQLLARSATGQTLTSYVTMVTGQVPTYDKESKQEKPKELHIILMDNGRLDMAKDPVFKEAFQCLRCAACLNVCPVYQLVGGHVYGHIYAGGIGTILTAFFNSMSDSENIQNLCLQCRRCTETCPGKVDIPKLILELRNRSADKGSIPFTQKVIFQKLLTDRRKFHSILRLASKVQAPMTKGSAYIRHLPFMFSDMTKSRSLPAIADVPFRDKIKKMKQEVKKPKGKVAIYAGCMVDFAYPEIGESAVKVLNKKGYEVVFPDKQSCCGAPAVYSGDAKTGEKLAKQNIEALEGSNADYIVSACPTCTEALAKKFVNRLENDKAWYERAKKVAEKSIDFVKLIDIINDGKEGKKGNKKVTYHTSCHLKRSMGIFEEPRRVLNSAGCEVVEMKETDRCCGMAGSYGVKFPEISEPILKRKLQNIEDAGVDTLAVDCPGCLMQLRGGLDKSNSKVKAKHTAEILAEQIK